MPRRVEPRRRFDGPLADWVSAADVDVLVAACDAVVLLAGDGPPVDAPGERPHGLAVEDELIRVLFPLGEPDWLPGPLYLETLRLRLGQPLSGAVDGLLAGSVVALAVRRRGEAARAAGAPVLCPACGAEPATDVHEHLYCADHLAVEAAELDQLLAV